jgi:hypothetical protein
MLCHDPKGKSRKAVNQGSNEYNLISTKRNNGWCFFICGDKSLRQKGELKVDENETNF